MSTTVCWDCDCKRGKPICCFECEDRDECEDVCDDTRCYKGGASEE